MQFICPSIHISICLKIFLKKRIKKCKFLNLDNVKLTPQSLVLAGVHFEENHECFIEAETNQASLSLRVVIGWTPWSPPRGWRVRPTSVVTLWACSVSVVPRPRTRLAIGVLSTRSCPLGLHAEKHRDDYLVNGVPDIIKLVPIIYICTFILSAFSSFCANVMGLPMICIFAWFTCLHICVWVFLCNWNHL